MNIYIRTETFFVWKYLFLSFCLFQTENAIHLHFALNCVVDKIYFLSFIKKPLHWIQLIELTLNDVQHCMKIDCSYAVYRNWNRWRDIISIYFSRKISIAYRPSNLVIRIYLPPITPNTNSFFRFHLFNFTIF